MKTNTKTLVASLSLAVSFGANAGIGGLNVQSALGEPFSGSIIVTGKEAQALIESGRVNVSGGGISGSVVPQNNGNVVIRLRSGSAVHEPVLNFVVQAGQQTRQYTALLNPTHYRPAQQTNRTVVAENDHTETKVKARSNRAERGSKPLRRPMVKKASTATVPVIERTGNTYHEVQKGESLAQIAERYRPHNVSMSRAMRALMAANPRAFRAGTRGNVMYDKATLYIPTEAQWQAYASKNVPSKRRPARIQRRNPVSSDGMMMSGQQASAPATQATVAPTVNSSVSQSNTINATNVATPSSPVVADKTVVIASSEPITEKTVTSPNVASVPASVASQVIDKQTASAASVVVAPIETASETASVPVVSPAKSPKPVAPPPPVAAETEPETDWMQLGLMGLGGAVVLGGIAYVLTRRRKSDEAVDDADDDVFLNEKNTTVSAAQALQRSWDSPDNVSTVKADTFDLNDKDDNFFIDESIATQQKNQPNETFNLNDFEPENIQSASAASVTEESEEEWDWLAVENETSVASNESNEFVSTETVIEVYSNATEEFIVEQEVVSAQEVSSDESWLNDILSHEDNVQTDSAPSVAVDELVFEDFSVPVTEMLPETDIAAVEAESFDLDLGVDTAIENTVFEVAPENQVFAVSDEMDFSLPETTETSLVENVAVLTVPEMAVEEISFGLPETVVTDEVNLNFDVADVEEVELPQSFELPEAQIETPVEFAINDDSGINLDLADEVQSDDGLMFIDESAVLETNEPWLNNLDVFETEVKAEDTQQVDFVDSLDDLGSTESVSDNTNSIDTTLIIEENPAEFGAAIPQSEELAWDSQDDDLPETTNSAGFVSEAVGMEAPHEAKLELAKMYLEIDDAVAARETLRELIGESSGELQAQAKQLLEELGG